MTTARVRQPKTKPVTQSDMTTAPAADVAAVVAAAVVASSAAPVVTAICVVTTEVLFSTSMGSEVQLKKFPQIKTRLKHDSMVKCNTVQ